jgi:serine/threonine-protein kinase
MSTDQDEVEKLQNDLLILERNASQSKALADAADRQGTASRALFERSGASQALVDAKREQIAARDAKRSAREAVARDLRRQIEQLRAQLARYAEALEEDLASRREKVALRAREAVALERTFTDVTNILLQHLKGKQECRDLLTELLQSLGMSTPTNTGPNSQNSGTKSPSDGRSGLL